MLAACRRTPDLHLPCGVNCGLALPHKGCRLKDEALGASQSHKQVKRADGTCWMSFVYEVSLGKANGRV